MTVTHLNPAALHRNPAFSQGTIAPAGRTLYVGEQNGTDATGQITGGLEEQTAQALRNVLAVLEEGGASVTDVVKLTQRILDGFGSSSGVDARLQDERRGTATPVESSAGTVREALLLSQLQIHATDELTTENRVHDQQRRIVGRRASCRSMPDAQL